MPGVRILSAYFVIFTSGKYVGQFKDAIVGHLKMYSLIIW